MRVYVLKFFIVIFTGNIYKNNKIKISTKVQIVLLKYTYICYEHPHLH